MIEDKTGELKMSEDKFEIKDSGERQTFDSGAVRDAAKGKSRPDLISPFFLWDMGRHLGKAAESKYGERNWEKGMPISRCYASAMRHLLAFGMGECDEDHLIAAATNLMFIRHYQVMIGRGVLPPTLGDMPEYTRDVHSIQKTMLDELQQIASPHFDAGDPQGDTSVRGFVTYEPRHIKAYEVKKGMLLGPEKKEVNDVYEGSVQGSIVIRFVGGTGWVGKGYEVLVSYVPTILPMEERVSVQQPKGEK